MAQVSQSTRVKKEPDFHQYKVTKDPSVISDGVLRPWVATNHLDTKVSFRKHFYSCVSV